MKNIAKNIQSFGFHSSKYKPLTTEEGKNLWGGKGFNLQILHQLKMPVPPGFTFSTEVCHAFEKKQGDTVTAITEQIPNFLAMLESFFGYVPLLSVRSGAPVSMPGMMDTILNVGLTSSNLGDWADRVGIRCTLDNWRRFMEMFASVALEFDAETLKGMEEVREHFVKVANVASVRDLDENYLGQICLAYQKIYEMKAADSYLDNAVMQLVQCIRAVFKSWNNPRAIEYRKQNKIPEGMGTACTVQAMVFGNYNEKSGSGVLFTRNPTTGENLVVGEYLPNAQGEEVVAGTATPYPLSYFETLDNKLFSELITKVKSLEDYFNEVQDVEFTIQDSKLYILQTRSAKRQPQAAARFAHDFWKEGKIASAKDALKRLTKAEYSKLRQPQIDPEFKEKHLAVGLSGSSGIAIGRPVFSSEDAVKYGAKEPVILVSKETTPDDIAGMNAAVGILTQTGGFTSHAAVVARGMNKPCVTGCENIVLEDGGQKGIVDTTGKFHEFSGTIAFDGLTGRVWNMAVPVKEGGTGTYFDTLVSEAMADDVSTYVSTDNPEEVGTKPKMVFNFSSWAQKNTSKNPSVEKLVGDLLLASTKLKGDMVLVIDLNSAKANAVTDDAPLLAMGGKTVSSCFEKARPEFVGALLDIVPDPNWVVKGPITYVQALAHHGYRRCVDLEFVQDVFTSKDMACSKKFVETHFGGEEGFAEFLKAFKMHGMEVPTIHMDGVPEQKIVQGLLK